MFTEVDSLKLMFGQALGRLRAIDFDGISGQASDAAAVLEEQDWAFINKYLEWLRAQQYLISEKIEVIESRMDPAGAGTGAMGN
jgi:hypothetical protein